MSLAAVAGVVVEVGLRESKDVSESKKDKERGNWDRDQGTNEKEKHAEDRQEDRNKEDEEDGAEFLLGNLSADFEAFKDSKAINLVFQIEEWSEGKSDQEVESGDDQEKEADGNSELVDDSNRQKREKEVVAVEESGAVEGSFLRLEAVGAGNEKAKGKGHGQETTNVGNAGNQLGERPWSENYNEEKKKKERGATKIQRVKRERMAQFSQYNFHASSSHLPVVTS